MIGSRDGLTALLLCAMVAGLSCSDNPAVRRRYEAEKQFARVEKRLRDFHARQQPGDTLQLREITASYRDLLGFCIGTLDSINDSLYPADYRDLKHLAFRSGTRLSQLYFSARQYDTCVVVLKRLLEGVGLEGSPLVATRLNLAKAFQSSGAWDSALVIYNDLIAGYYPPVDTTGEVLFSLFSLPANIYLTAAYTGDSLESMTQLRRAESYYNKLVSDFPGTKLEVAGRASLSKLYRRAGQWEKAIAELTELDRLGNPDNPMIRLEIADIYGAKLGRTDRALELYTQLRERINQDDTLNYPLLQFKISIMLMQKGRYAEARQKLVEVKRDYPVFFAGSPLAQLTIARSFELEGKWNRAEAEYDLLIEKHPGSDEAMSTYLHIADYYKKNNRMAEADRWYRKAEEYYDRMSVRGAGTLLEAKALIFKADLYQRREDPEKTAAILLDLFNRYPQSEPGRRAMAQAIDIYRQDLGQAARADSLTEVFKAALSQVDETFEI
ncbi:MAG: tetratricopeptide repeat protein [candidate division Zixibacteria bacterium]|nr:tetratricopeptide repeat protein [candidate division Zixibacteria bacterium]